MNNDPQLAVLTAEVAALKIEVTALRGDLRPLAELVTRHDERLTSLTNERNSDRTLGRNWLSALSVAALAGLWKTFLGG